MVIKLERKPSTAGRRGRTDVENDHVVEFGGTWLSPFHSAALQLAEESSGFMLMASMALRLGVEIYNASFVHGSSPPPEEDWPWFYWGSDYPKEQWPLLGKRLGFKRPRIQRSRNPNKG